MIKKLRQLINSLFSEKTPNIPVNKEVVKPTPVINSPEMKKEVVTMNLDTGKIIFPDSMSEEDKKEIEAALNELNENLQKLAPADLFASLEDFIEKGGKAPNDPFSEEFPIWEGLTSVNNENEGLSKIKEEMEFCEEQTQHWSDNDFVEALLDFENQGYEFIGFEEIFHKTLNQLELTSEEAQKLRQLYKLATQEFVYGL
jgi:hypothetical protein